MNKQGYQRVLLIGGLIVALVGVIMWMWAAGAKAPATWYGNQQAIDQANAWMWVGIVATILGVLTVLAYIIVRSATASAEEPAPERLDLRQRQAQRVAEQRSGSGVAELQTIAGLHERGLLSDAEFESAKQRLLRSSS